jgi:hypothetical protein
MEKRLYEAEFSVVNILQQVVNVAVLPATNDTTADMLAVP